MAQRLCASISNCATTRLYRESKKKNISSIHRRYVCLSTRQIVFVGNFRWIGCSHISFVRKLEVGAPPGRWKTITIHLSFCPRATAENRRRKQRAVSECAAVLRFANTSSAPATSQRKNNSIIFGKFSFLYFILFYFLFIANRFNWTTK